MKRREMLLSTGLTALGLSQLPWPRAAAAAKPKRKLLMFTKSAGFEHSVAKRDGDKLSHNERIVTELARPIEHQAQGERGVGVLAGAIGIGEFGQPGLQFLRGCGFQRLDDLG